MQNTAVLSILAMVANVTVAQVPVSDATTSDLASRVATLERVVNAKRTGQLNMQTQIETIQEEVDELRGTLETHSHKLEQILNRQRELYSDIDRLVSRTDNAQVQVLPVTDSSNSTTVVTAPSAIMVNDEAMYTEAVDLVMKEKRYDDAVPAFESFLASHPSSRYVPNAHYWLGQLKFNRGDWKAAQEHFSTVVNDHPNSNKRPASMLKLGDALLKLGNTAKAQEIFESLQASYPDSTAKKFADTRLRKLKQNN